jgi:hypothetical protein
MNHAILIDQLKQLKTITWDGDLISKSHRDWLVDRGYVDRSDGFNYLNESGVKLIKTLFLATF